MLQIPAIRRIDFEFMGFESLRFIISDLCRLAALAGVLGCDRPNWARFVPGGRTGMRGQETRPIVEVHW